MKKNAFAIIALVLLFTSSSILAQKNTNIEKNKDFLNVYTEDFWNKHNIAAYDKYFTSDFVYHYAEGDMNGEQYKGLCQAYITAFPDLHITTNDLIAEGDKITKIWTAQGTHKGELMGIPATGKPILVKGIEVFRLADGKIAELWASMDNLGMMQQLGVIPPLGE
ncbi:MAG: ester cyclase [Bacteroidales bacterium]|nr:ester cyclase [Bacteroidales bacterium]